MTFLSVLKKENYTKTSWKNGLGISHQIDLEPDTTAKTSFIFRLSQAEVSNDNPFSAYKDFQRLLVITKGNGLLLNDNPLLPLTVFSFSGNENIFCRLINGPCTDLGLIYDRKKVSASMDVFNQVSKFPEIKLHLDGEINYLFLVSGQLSFGNKTINPQDTLKVTQKTTLTFVTELNSTYLVIKINFL